MGIERTQLKLEHSTFEPAFVAGSLHIASYGKLRDLIPGAFMLIKFKFTSGCHSQYIIEPPAAGRATWQCSIQGPSWGIAIGAIPLLVAR